MGSLVIVFALATFGAIAWFVKATWIAFKGPLSAVPGPLLNRYSNLPLKIQTLKGRRIFWVHDIHERYGEYVVLSPSEVAVSNVATAKEIHRVGTSFLKARWYQELTQEFESPGLFAMRDPKAHGARRKLFSQAFSQQSLKDWEPLLQEKSELVISKIKAQATEGRANLFDWWSYFANDMITELSFGQNFGALDQGKKTEFSIDLENVFLYSAICYELDPFPQLAKYLPIPALQHFLKARERLNARGRTAIAHTKMLEKRGEAKGTFFSKMISEEEGNGLNPALVQREATNLTVAGSDTTAVTLTYLIWAVLKRPDVRQKLLDDIETLRNGFTSQDAEALPYLRAVAQESLRLYGAAPGGLPRIVPQGGKMIGPYHLQQDIVVSTHAYTMHRSESIFERPSEFIPERWFVPSQMMKDAFMPFGAGSRICLGIHLARLELSLCVVKFFQNCPDATLHPTMTDDDMEFENFFLVAPKSHKCDITIPRLSGL